MTQNYSQPTSPKAVSAKTNSNRNHHSEQLIAKRIVFQPSSKDGQKKDDVVSLTVAQAIVKVLEDIGVRQVFGVSGGAMATLWAALSNSPLIDVIHCRHEGGAAFAATEAYFSSGRPVVVFTTAGPGITNALTGLLAARDEGAKVIHLSACTSAPQRGRWAIQETSSYTLPTGGIFTSGALFHYGTVVESPKELPQIARRLGLGLAQPGGFVAHISIPTRMQSTPIETPLPLVNSAVALPVPSQHTVTKVAKHLCEGPFAIWVGFGARHAADSIRQLAQRTGAAVMCSPRGKGIFPETHPQFIGVTGLGGHDSVATYMQEHRPLRTLVLGTRLGEPTSFWNEKMIPPQGFIHVDVDPKVPGVAYPFAPTLPIVADADILVKALLEVLPETSGQTINYPNPESIEVEGESDNGVRPEILMEMVQKVVIDGSDAVVLAESGNSFTWSTHLLRFNEAKRYRVSTGVGSMGHNVTGVIGAAMGRKGKAVTIVGDGAMLMNSEVSTAVKYQIPAVWIVLNDARYNMCYQGMSMLGLTGADAMFPQTNFTAIANGMGAKGLTVETESQLEEALKGAMALDEPVVIDVYIDATRLAPSKGRNKGLGAQGVKFRRQEPKKGSQVSFPLV